MFFVPLWWKSGSSFTKIGSYRIHNNVHFPGEYVTDFCIVERADLYHLFHIRGERWTWPVGYREIDLGHATSPDLRTWTPQPPVLPVGKAGAWDERGNGVYYLYYTGSDRNNNQQIGLATSTDLYNWIKYPQPVVTQPTPLTSLFDRPTNFAQTATFVC